MSTLGNVQLVAATKELIAAFRAKGKMTGQGRPA
jgi:hypothetical protein